MVALEAEREQALVAVARDYFEGCFDGDAARLDRRFTRSSPSGPFVKSIRTWTRFGR